MTHPSLVKYCPYLLVVYSRGWSRLRTSAWSSCPFLIVRVKVPFSPNSSPCNLFLCVLVSLVKGAFWVYAIEVLVTSLIYHYWLSRCEWLKSLRHRPIGWPYTPSPHHSPHLYCLCICGMCHCTATVSLLEPLCKRHPLWHQALRVEA